MNYGQKFSSLSKRAKRSSKSARLRCQELWLQTKEYKVFEASLIPFATCNYLNQIPPYVPLSILSLLSPADRVFPPALAPTSVSASRALFPFAHLSTLCKPLKSPPKSPLVPLSLAHHSPHGLPGLSLYKSICPRFQGAQYNFINGLELV